MYGTASDGLLLRTGPGTQNEAIYLINYGRAVTVDKVKNGWAHASIDGMTGWCSMDYLTENAKKIKELPTISSEGRNPNQLADPINRVQSGNEPHGFVNTPGDTLNLRYGPGEQYGVIAEIPNGTSVVEYGWDGDWIYTEYKGQYGWIHSGYVIFGGGMAKPAIYLYPEKTMDISVQIKLKEGRFTRTAPEADGNWLVTAQPDGTLKDKATGKTYDYIFWESDSKPPYDWSEGYVVEGFASKGFLEEILPKMGLNEKECREFVDYWVPRMQKNPLNLISFQTTCYTDVAQMKVKPKPDSVLRVFMTFKPVKTPISVKAPKIKPFERKGFTVVEWGGSEVE